MHTGGGDTLIKFKSVNATTDYGLDFVNITFSIEDTREDLSDYQFDLLRSNCESDDFYVVYSNIQDFECNDYAVNLLNPESRYLYKIRATHIPTEFSIESNDFSYPEVDPDRYAFYLSEIYSMYLEAIGNQKMYLLKRKRTGDRCECYDDVRGARLSDKCPICFGTGYAGGFYKPIEIMVNFLSTAGKQEEVGLNGTFEATEPIQLWTQNYPLLQENDILVDSVTGERFTISHWRPSYKNGFLLRQTVQAEGIPESSRLYKVPVSKAR